MRLPHKSKRIDQNYDLKGHRALIITTSQATLDKIDAKTGKVLKRGKPTGVYASEMTEPYYTFQDAGLHVDIASIQGGPIPIERLSLLPLVRTDYDKRFLKDKILNEKVADSRPIAEIDLRDYDIVFLAGGWGAAYDLAQSEVLALKISEAYADKVILGAVCHGPLGLVKATKPDGSPLLEGVHVTGVTNKQIKQLGVGITPKHPETELKRSKGIYSCDSGLIDMLKNHVVTDKEHLIVTGQNQKGAIEAAVSTLELLNERSES